MKPIGPLMREHRLIERMISILQEKLSELKSGKDIDLSFIDVAVDFLKTYADRTHHGKEEDILFQELARKPLTAEHKRIMDELLQEHALARNTVRTLIDVKTRCDNGDADGRADLITGLNTLVHLYPEHIHKEDKHFFYPVLEYFSAEEQTAMLDRFRDFDGKMVHEKYRTVVETLAGGDQANQPPV